MARRGIGNVSSNTIYIKGYQNVLRSYAKVGKAANKNIRKRLKLAIEPVRAKAQELGPRNIRNLRPSPTASNRSDWAAVRMGVTQRFVYIAPVERGRTTNEHRRRPNFKALELGKGYEPALAIEKQEVIDRFGGIFDDIQHAWRS